MDRGNILRLRDTIQCINGELRSKKIYPIEYLLLRGSVDETMNILSTCSDSFQAVMDDPIIEDGKESEYYTIKDLIRKYCDIVKKRYAKSFIPKTFADEDTYFNKLSEPVNIGNTPIIYPKSSIVLSEDELQKTISLVRDAITVYYNVYNNKRLLAELTTGNSTEYMEFSIHVENLLHLLGVTVSQLRGNPDFVRLTGNRYMNAQDILMWIVKDAEGNNDLLDFTANIFKKANFDIVRNQLSSNTANRLLNYHKVRARSQAFMLYGPYDNVSLVAKLNPGSRLTQNSRSNTAMITRANVFMRYPWAYFGSVQNPSVKYIETLVLDSNLGKRTLLSNSAPAIITRIIDDSSPGGDGGIIFSTDEQFALFAEAYDSFRDVLDLEGLKNYFNDLGYDLGDDHSL